MVRAVAINEQIFTDTRVAQARQQAVRIGLITLLLTTLLVIYILSQNGNNPLTFAWIGTRYADLDPQGTIGYDGQFAYYIARDGFAAAPSLDNVSWRFQRILYPVLARSLMVGDLQLLPWIMIGINVIAHSVGAALLTYMLVLQRAPAWGGLIYALWIGSLFGVRLDLHEPLCLALSLAAIVAYIHRRERWVMLCLVLATATKEIGLVFTAAIALHAFGERRWNRGIYILSGPVLFTITWWGALWLVFGQLPVGTSAASLTIIPLVGILAVTDIFNIIMYLLWLVLPAGVMIMLGVRHFWHHRELPLGLTLLMGGTYFFTIMPTATWVDPVAAFRVATTLVVTAILFIGWHMPKQIKWLAVLWMPTVFVFMMLIQVLNSN